MKTKNLFIPVTIATAFLYLNVSSASPLSVTCYDQTETVPIAKIKMNDDWKSARLEYANQQERALNPVTLTCETAFFYPSFTCNGILDSQITASFWKDARYKEMYFKVHSSNAIMAIFITHDTYPCIKDKN